MAGACDKIKGRDLNRKVIVQVRTNVRKAGGGQTTTWADVKEVWAKLKPRSTREREIAAQLESDTDFIITIRFDAALSLDHDNRLKFGTRFFNVQSVINIDEANRFYEIGAKETKEAAI